MRKKVTHIRVDGEKGVVSPVTKEKLLLDNKVTVDNSGKKNHSIQTLDRKVHTLKDHVSLSVPFAVGGIMLMALFQQMTDIINIIQTRGNHNNLSPFQAMLGRSARMKDICPHKPLETLLVSNYNDVTNNTLNENMRDLKIDPSSPTLRELLQSAPILGRKRSRNESHEPPHVIRDMFQEEIAASFINKRDIDEKRCMIA